MTTCALFRHDNPQLLAFQALGPEESEDSWSEHAGLAAALRRFLPEVRRQRCTVHLQRNVLAKVPHRLHTEIKRRIRSAGAFSDRASALRLITAVALRTTAVWSERRYLDLSLLEPKEVAKAA